MPKTEVDRRRSKIKTCFHSRGSGVSESLWGKGGLREVNRNPIGNADQLINCLRPCSYFYCCRPPTLTYGNWPIRVESDDSSAENCHIKWANCIMFRWQNIKIVVVCTTSRSCGTVWKWGNSHTGSSGTNKDVLPICHCPLYIRVDSYIPHVPSNFFDCSTINLSVSHCPQSICSSSLMRCHHDARVPLHSV